MVCRSTESVEALVIEIEIPVGTLITAAPTLPNWTNLEVSMRSSPNALSTRTSSSVPRSNKTCSSNAVLDAYCLWRRCHNHALPQLSSCSHKQHRSFPLSGCDRYQRHSDRRGISVSSCTTTMSTVIANEYGTVDIKFDPLHTKKLACI